jgi:hypothetical protein
LTIALDPRILFSKTPLPMIVPSPIEVFADPVG